MYNVIKQTGAWSAADYTFVLSEMLSLGAGVMKWND